MRQKVLVILIWVCFGFWVFYWTRIYISDVNYKKSQTSLTNLDTKKALEYANRSIYLNPKEPSYYRNRAKVLTVYMLDDNNVLTKELILYDLRKALSLNQNNLVTIRNSIPLYFFLAVGNINDPPGKDNIDENYLSITKEFFSYVKKRYPHDLGVVVTLANYERKLGLMEEYNKSIGIVKDLRPEILDWHQSFR